MKILNMVFNMSITGSVMFFIFLLLRPITKKHFNSSWHYKMLILILTFFIIPVDNFIKLPIIPIPNIANLENEEARFQKNININTIEAEKNSKDNIIIEKENPEYEIKDNPKNKDIDPSTTEIQDFQDIKFNINIFKEIIKYIWLIGVIALLLLKITPYIRFKSSILKYSVEVEDDGILELFNMCKDELNINTKVHLRTSNTIGPPMLVGILHPTVLIPNIDKDYKKLKMIFLHELNHYKRNDILIKALGLIINSLHWFNPLVYILLKEMDKYCEYSIDEKVVAEMDINDRKYYGETILSLIGSSMLKKSSLTTAMGSSGKQLKTRLENMIYSFKTNRKKQIISLFIGILILISGFTVACSILPVNAPEENDPFVVYIKEDGLYYSHLNGGNEVNIHEGNGFEYPLISSAGYYIAYTKDDSLFIYSIKDKSYEKIADEIEHYYIAYDWIDDETIVYGSNRKPGFTILNVLSKDKTEHLDEYYYTGLESSNNNIVYGTKMNRWTTEDGDFITNEGIVEININNYDKKNKRFATNIILEGRKSTDEMIGYNPIVWNISADGRYIYIMEKPASGSLSADGIGIGIYDVEEKTHTEFTDITTLSYKNHLAINPSNNIIGLIEGSGREMIENKEVILLDIYKDKTYKIIKFMDNDLVAMTPSFTLDGEKLLYSATKNVLNNRTIDLNSVYDQWDNQPHNIYEYDLETSEVKQVTDGKYFDFMPIDISNNEILFSRYKGNDYYSLIKLVNGKENIIVDNVMFSGGNENYPFGFYGHIQTEKGMDIFINKDGKSYSENKPINNNNSSTTDILEQLSNQEFFITGEGPSNSDDEVIVEFGKSFVNLFNGGIAKQKKVSFEKYISNENLRKFVDKMLELTQIQDIKGSNDVNYGLENEFGEVVLRQHSVDKLWYLELPYQFEGSGMTAKMLITSHDKALKLVDLYFGSKDGVDTFATGHPADRKIRDQHLWDDEDWVKDVFIKLKDFEKMLESQNGNISSTEDLNLDLTTYETINNLEGVTMKIKEETLSNVGITVILENKSDNEYLYGEFFSLEKKIDDSWYQLPVAIDGNYGFDDIGYDLLSGDSREWKVDWSWLYGNLNHGEYRIVKDMIFSINSGDYGKYYLSAEFSLE